MSELKTIRRVPMYRIRKSIDIDFSHHVRGHAGACINLHGHTWKFEVEIGATELDAQGFVVDFGLLKRRVLAPCHALLDHSLAVGRDTFEEVEASLVALGSQLLASQTEPSSPPPVGVSPLAGARNVYPGGMKVALFGFTPTSERLAHWLFELSRSTLDDSRVSTLVARVYETLHPVESVAEYWE